MELSRIRVGRDTAYMVNPRCEALIDSKEVSLNAVKYLLSGGTIRVTFANGQEPISLKGTDVATLNQAMSLIERTDDAIRIYIFV